MLHVTARQNHTTHTQIAGANRPNFLHRPFHPGLRTSSKPIRTYLPLYPNWYGAESAAGPPSRSRSTFQSTNTEVCASNCNAWTLVPTFPLNCSSSSNSHHQGAQAALIARTTGTRSIEFLNSCFTQRFVGPTGARRHFRVVPLACAYKNKTRRRGKTRTRPKFNWISAIYSESHYSTKTRPQVDLFESGGRYSRE